MRKPTVNKARLVEKIKVKACWDDYEDSSVEDVVVNLQEILKEHPKAYFEVDYWGYESPDINIYEDIPLETEQEWKVRVKAEQEALEAWMLNKPLEAKTKEELLDEINELKTKLGETE